MYKKTMKLSIAGAVHKMQVYMNNMQSSTTGLDVTQYLP